VRKKRDVSAVFAEARRLAETAVRDAPDVPGRTERLAAGLTALHPAPLAAVLLSGPTAGGLSVVDEVGHPRPDWHDAVRPILTGWMHQPGPMPLLTAIGLPEHILCGAVVGWENRRHGALAVALHRRAIDVALAQALLTYLADQVGFRLFLEGAERQRLSRYRDLGDLTNLVGHEFNNVLNSVGLQLAALGQRGLTPDHFPELAEMRKQVAAAGRMVQRLQDFCQQGSPPRQPADLNAAVSSAAADQELAGRVRLQLEPGLPAVQGAAFDLERLAGSLLRGAAVGPGEVTVRTGKGAGTAVWLRVEDAGDDPDDDLFRHLFEPFVRLRDGDDGVSLGLARAVARRLGGSVRGERRPGGGMVFVAELRAAE
jgi:signal transduction histidine kinase